MYNQKKRHRLDQSIQNKNLLNFKKYLIGLLFLNLISENNSHANVVGTDSQNFNPITSGLDFVTVHSSETLQPHYINLGVFLNYAVNTLPYFDNTNPNISKVSDSLLGLDLNAGYGLAKNWDVGISFPHIVMQELKNNDAAQGFFDKKGLTEIRLNTKYRLMGNDDGGVALVASVNFNQTLNSPYMGDKSEPIYNLEIAADKMIGPTAVGINVGHRWRRPGAAIAGTPIQPFKNQFIASAAVNYLIPTWSLKFIGEVFGSRPTQPVVGGTQRSDDSLEGLLGLKKDVTQMLAAHTGFGTSLLHGVASPDWRVYAGLNYVIGPDTKMGERLEMEKVEQYKVKAPQEPADDGPSARYRIGNIRFAFDSDELTPESKGVVDQMVEQLKLKEGFKFLMVEGHTDSIGSDEYNLRLSQARAESIRKYLFEGHKLALNKIQAIGYGPSRPIADNGNAQGRGRNRRVEIEFKF